MKETLLRILGSFEPVANLRFAVSEEEKNRCLEGMLTEKEFYTYISIDGECTYIITTLPADLVRHIMMLVVSWEGYNNIKNKQPDSYYSNKSK